MSDCGTRILLQGVYPYDVPEAPLDKSLIINSEIKDPLEQYWRTPEMPDFKLMSAYEIEKFIYMEWDRMMNGVCFMNKGVITYINGAHYEYLRYWNPGFPLEFREADRLYFYFDEFVDSRECLGKVIFKPRVGGFSAKENFLCFRKSKAGFRKKVALINTTLENAKKLNYQPIVEGYLNYPDAFKPKIKTNNGRIPETGLAYKPTMEGDSKKYLMGWLAPFAPKANSLDGKRTNYIFFDEISKLESIDPEVIIKPYLKTYFNPAKNEIEGRMTFVSTLGTDDNLMKQAIAFYLRMWNDSNIEEVDEETGRTASGFLRYFISCLDVSNIDKYGFPDREKTLFEQQQKLQKIIKEDGEFSRSHIIELRENPITIEDIKNVQKTGATFNVNGIVSEQRESVDNTPVENRGYFTGKFIDGNTIDRSSKYINYGWQFFVDKGYGRGLHRKSGDQYVVCRNPDGTVGYDPYRIGKPISKNFSNAGIVVYQVKDTHSKNGIKKEVIATFSGRSTDPEEIHEQAVFAALYYGFIFAPETNIGTDWYKKNGYYNLIPMSWYQKGTRGIMITTGKGEKNVQEHGIKGILKWVIGKLKSKLIPNIKTLKCIRLLIQLESFVASDNDALNKADMVAAFLQAILVSDKLIESDDEKKEKPKSTLHSMYHSFSQNGTATYSHNRRY